MKRAFAFLLSAAVGFMLAGCGGGASNSSNSGSNSDPSATIQSGQWEFDFQPPVPVNNGIPAEDAFMEVDLQVTETQFFAGMNAITGYEPYFSPTVQHSAFIGYPFPSGYIMTTCEGSDTVSGVTNAVSGSTPNLNFRATVGDGTDDSFLTATISGTNVTSFSGQWTGNVGGHEPWQCLSDGTGSSTFIATAIAPLNGTFIGTLQTSNSSTDQILLTISQNGFLVSASGTATSASLSITQADVIGALVYGNGTATNVNGADSFQFGGHIHPDGKSVDVVIKDGNGTVEWGTLVQQ